MRKVFAGGIATVLVLASFAATAVQAMETSLMVYSPGMPIQKLLDKDSLTAERNSGYKAQTDPLEGDSAEGGFRPYNHQTGEFFGPCFESAIDPSADKRP